MMNGKVTFNREAIIELKMIGSNREQKTVEATIDTGFNGYLTLSSDTKRVIRLVSRIFGRARGPRPYVSILASLSAFISGCF